MSSIRLYVLGAFAERGAMHGHALRALAEEEHIDEWTDFTVGAVYGVLKRLATDGLIEVDRVEREGNYPERQVYRITPAGEDALERIRQEGLESIDDHSDPFDLAFARLDPDRLDELHATISARLDELIRRREESIQHHKDIARYLWSSEKWALSHQLATLTSDVEWHQQLLEALPEIISDERARRLVKGHKDHD
jgi:DNA-binding PadR family transcriptional regulator